jgi:hypothetical protein
MTKIALVLVAVLAAGAAQAKKYVGQQPYQNEGVTITPVGGDPFDHDGDKLWVKLQVENKTDRFILVDRNLIVARTPDGREFKRILPMAGKGDAFVLPPGASERIDMEFSPKKNVLPLTLAMTGFFGLDTRPIPMKDYVIGEPKKEEPPPPPPPPPVVKKEPPPPPKPRVAIGKENRPVWSLFGVGVAGSLLAYLPAAIAGPINGNPEGLVPLVGPFIMLRSVGGPNGFNGEAAAFVIMDGLLQVGSAAIAVLGTVLKREVTLYAKDGRGRSLAEVRLLPAPGGGSLRITF